MVKSTYSNPRLDLIKINYLSWVLSGFIKQTQLSGYRLSTASSWKGSVRHFRHLSVKVDTAETQLLDFSLY